MENKQTAVEWMFDKLLEEGSNGTLRWHLKYDIFKIFEQAKEMEKMQHGETWDSALIATKARGFNFVRAIVDFSDYWQKRNTPDSEGVSQPEVYPEGMCNSTTPPGEHCEEA